MNGEKADLSSRIPAVRFDTCEYTLFKNNFEKKLKIFTINY